MIPRTLVPEGARLPAEQIPSTRRRPTNLDERTLVPSALPIIQLDGKSTIPTNLPLEAIASRTVVPRDINVELVQTPEESTLPPQPTEMDERITIPVGAVPPEELPPLPEVSEELVEPDIIRTGEVAFLPPVERDYRGTDERIARWISMALYALLLLSLPYTPKLFRAHVPTAEEQEIARRQMVVLLPPGALESLKPSPPPASSNPNCVPASTAKSVSIRPHAPSTPSTPPTTAPLPSASSSPAMPPTSKPP